MYLTAILGDGSLPPAASSARAPRGARSRALAMDLAWYAGIQVVTGTVAIAIFVLQTDGGARDLSTGTATVGWAIALAAVPAWIGLLGHSAFLGGTPGQRGAGLEIEGAPTRRLVRLAAHPLGSLGWMWLAVVAALGTVPGVPLMLTAAALIVLAGGVASAAILLRDPSALPLHDRLAGTRLVAR